MTGKHATNTPRICERAAFSGGGSLGLDSALELGLSIDREDGEVKRRMDDSSLTASACRSSAEESVMSSCRQLGREGGVLTEVVEHVVVYLQWVVFVEFAGAMRGESKGFGFYSRTDIAVCEERLHDKWGFL